MDCNTMIPWRPETNWAVAHGSLEALIAIESSDHLIDECDLENTAPKSPLVLEPRGFDSDPCEIKISFEQKYDISQINIRSTARVYEVYHAHSAHSSNEYVCTVRCGVAKRDDNILQTTCIEDVAEGHGFCLLGEVTEETGTCRGSIVNSEDDWVKIKVPEVGKNCLSDMIKTDGTTNIEDLYEATAQISNADPCSFLTIRLLSLQDKSHVYIDEIYVFVDPAESTDTGNEAVLAGSTTQNSLMFMVVPALLQLSKSGISRARDECAYDEVLKDSKTEFGSRGIDEIDVGLEKTPVQQHVKLKELDDMETRSRRVDEFDGVLENSKVCHQYVKSKELNEDMDKLVQLEQSTSPKKCFGPRNDGNLSPGNLERSLEELISGVSRVEDICLRFEEKMLMPIQSIEARLQQVENQLEKLAMNSLHKGLTHCTRISAPVFLFSESNSSSFYDEQGTELPHEENNYSSCDNMPELSHDANFHPSLIVSAPEFSCSEDEDNNVDFKPLRYSPCIKPKKVLSVDNALAAALNGFLSTAATHTSEHIQTTSCLSGKVDEESQYQEHAGAEDGNGEAAQFAEMPTAKASDFTAEEAGEEDHLDYTLSSLGMSSIIESKQKYHGDEMVPSSIQGKNSFNSAEMCDYVKNKSTVGFESASNCDFPPVSVNMSRTSVGNGHILESSEVCKIDNSFEENASWNPLKAGNDSASDRLKDSVETDMHQIYDETNPRKTFGFNPDEDIASKQVLGSGSKTASEVLESYLTVHRCLKDNILNASKFSCASLNFEFPILEVKFSSDVSASTKYPLEALLGGAAEPNTDVSSIYDGEDDNDGSSILMPCNNAASLLPINHLLIDVGISSADGASKLEDRSNLLGTSSSPEMNFLKVRACSDNQIKRMD